MKKRHYETPMANLTDFTCVDMIEESNTTFKSLGQNDWGYSDDFND